MSYASELNTGPERKTPLGRDFNPGPARHLVGNPIVPTKKKKKSHKKRDTARESLREKNANVGLGEGRSTFEDTVWRGLRNKP